MDINYKMNPLLAYVDSMGDSKRLEALRFLLTTNLSPKEALAFRREIYSLTKDKKDLVDYANKLFEFGFYDKAKKAYEEAYPVGLGEYIDCLERLNTDLDYISDIILKELNNSNDEALMVVLDFTERHSQYMNKFKQYTNRNTFHVGFLEEDNIKKLFNKKGYISNKDIVSIASHNSLDFNVVKSYLLENNIPYIPCIDMVERNSISRLVFFFDMCSKIQDFNPNVFWFIKAFSLDKKYVDFFYEGYKNNEYSHTPGEASIFLDISREEAIIKFEKMESFFKINELQERFKELIYILNDFYNNPKTLIYDPTIVSIIMNADKLFIK